jgi:hypothetical protein
MRFGTWNIKSLNGKEVEIVREMETRDEEACRRSRKMEGVRRGPTNAVRHHGEEKEEEEVTDLELRTALYQLQLTDFFR